MLLYLKDQCQAKYCLQLILSSGASQGGNGNPLQCPFLENPMVRGAWLGYSPWGWKDRTQLSMRALRRIRSSKWLWDLKNKIFKNFEMPGSSCFSYPLNKYSKMFWDQRMKNICSYSQKYRTVLTGGLCQLEPFQLNQSPVFPLAIHHGPFTEVSNADFAAVVK